MKNNYEFVDVVFNINTVYDYFHNFAKDYLSNKKPFECITVSSNDIKDWKKEHNIDTSKYSLEYVETLVVHSKLADILAKYNSYIIHGSSIYLDKKNNGYLFIAKSGTGKSTHVNILFKNYPNRIKYINDDKPFITLKNGSLYLYGSPFDGKERKSNNIKCKLKGIFILKRGLNNSVKKISKNKAMSSIANQIHIPNNSRKQAFEFIFKMINLVSFYELKVNKLDEASEVSYKIMAKKK